MHVHLCGFINLLLKVFVAQGIATPTWHQQAITQWQSIYFACVRSHALFLVFLV